MKRRWWAALAVVLFQVWYRRQPVGTRSVVAGAHFPPIHGFYVAKAWRALYGTLPTEIPIWVSFFLHDIGYWGLDNMDGDEGQQHPKRGAYAMYMLFDHSDGPHTWFDFTAGHSRYYAERIGVEPSDLMRPDKYATCIYPLWLYLLLVLHSGEGWEYTNYHLEYNKRESSGNRWVDMRWWVHDLRAEWARKYGPDAK